MANVLVEESSLSAIADSIRAKNGSSSTYKPAQMSGAIDAIPTGITPTGTLQITSNNTYDVTNYASAEVNVPNSYAAGDEGKVVSNGALVAQTAHAQVTQNGTIDTTLNNSVEIAVPAGGGGTFYSGTLTLNARPTADVDFAASGATHFAICLLNDANRNTGQGFFTHIVADGDYTLTGISNQSGSSFNNVVRYATGDRSTYNPGVKFTASGVTMINYTHNYYRWFQANTYYWCAW